MCNSKVVASSLNNLKVFEPRSTSQIASSSLLTQIMSLRRRSCNPCFTTRRKCDRTFPICSRCQRNNKNCQYAYLPRASDGQTAQPGYQSNQISRYITHQHYQQDTTPSAQNSAELEAQWHSIPKSLGRLGTQPRVVGLESHVWAFAQLRGYPQHFATRGENIFIHPTLYRSFFPASIRTAFGICAATLSLNQQTYSLIFQAVDAEVFNLLRSPLTGTLFESLAAFQALVLYQIVRVFYGDVKEQWAAEQQEYIVRSIGLRLLRQAEEELPMPPTTWESWIFAETVRRTVLFSFKLYTLYWSFRAGTCKENGALNHLPLSANPGIWDSQDVDLENVARDTIIAHGQLLERWQAAPQRKLDRYEKFLVVAWKGAPTVEALSHSRIEDE